MSPMSNHYRPLVSVTSIDASVSLVGAPKATAAVPESPPTAPVVVTVAVLMRASRRQRRRVGAEQPYRQPER